MKKRMTLIVLLVVLTFIMSTVANATITSSEYINSYVAQASRSGNKITVTFDIIGRETMDVVGVKTIIIQEKPTGSSTWNSVATLTSDNYSNMLAYDKRDHLSSISYTNAKDGYIYRAKVYFYAEKGGYDTREFITSAV